MLRFNQPLENDLKASVGSSPYNLTKNNKIQIVEFTEKKSLNVDSDLLQKWNNKCSNKSNDSDFGNFLQSTITNSPTDYSGATNVPPIISAFMYIETSSNNYGHERVFVSFERTDIIQISKITVYYYRFSF